MEPRDAPIVRKLDLLRHGLLSLITTLDKLHDRGGKFVSLTETIGTETLAGRAIWQMIGVLVELERSLIMEHARAGLKEAKR